MTHTDSVVLGMTWRECAYSILKELERKSEAVYNEDPALLIAERGEHMVTLGNDWDPEEFQMEAELLAMMAVRALINRHQWHPYWLSNLLTRKQHDYGTQNITAFGDLGIAVRLSDKIARLKNLRQRSALNESLVDTLIDIVGYYVVSTMLNDGSFFNEELGLADEPF